MYAGFALRYIRTLEKKHFDKKLFTTISQTFKHNNT